MFKWIKLIGGLLLVLGLTTTAPVMAQDFPNKALHLVCPYAPGGLSDVLARMLAKRLGERLGQQVIVENRTGGGGIIGVEAVANSAPDGYTILLTSQGLASVNASLYGNLSYDTLRDFAPVGLLSTFPLVWVSSPRQGPKTFQEFLVMARAKPGALSYGSAGNASTSHLMAELLKDQANIDVIHVPFRGEAPAFQEVMADRITGIFATLGGALPLIQSGRLSALAIGTKERSTLLPNVPTVSESGVPNFVVEGWYGILAPSKTPKPILERLRNEIIAITKEAEFRGQLQARGMDPVDGTPDTFGKLIASETERWRQVVQKAGIKPE
jgi:tripartite-type tricarboxylate transporter receptor subunit TctC